MATEKHDKSLIARAELLDRIRCYVVQDHWTPAEGALLVNGVIPPTKLFSAIPASAMQLEQPTLPAAPEQLTHARYVLKDYQGYVEDGDMPADKLTPLEFLEWCNDRDFFPSDVPMLVQFLRYFFYPGTNEIPGVTQTVEDELKTLRLAIAAEAFQLSATVPTTENSPVKIDVPSLGNGNSQLSQAIGEPAVEQITSSVQNSHAGLTKLEQQIQAIEAGADAKGFNKKSIKRGEKKALSDWCLEHYPESFKSSSAVDRASKFNEAWKMASRCDRIIMKNRDTYANRK